MKSIVLVGSGNVATHLGIALKSRNYLIKQVFSRELKNAKRLAKILDSDFTNNLQDLKTAELIIVSIKDSEISKVISQLNGPNIIHTSGYISLDVFSTEFDNYGVLYPLQTFNKNIEIDIENTPFCIEASNTFFEKELMRIGKSISKEVIYLNSKQRQQLHIAAVFACNFTNHLFTISDDILSKIDIKFSILLPLIKQTIKQIENNKAKDVQTGPAKRNDIVIIEKHLNSIVDEDIKEIYKKISDNIIKNYE